MRSAVGETPPPSSGVLRKLQVAGGCGGGDAMVNDSVVNQSSVAPTPVKVGGFGGVERGGSGVAEAVMDGG